MNPSKIYKGQLVSEEIAIGKSVLTIRAAKPTFFGKVKYGIVVSQEKKQFIHSTCNDLQNIMADFTKLCQDYKTMIRECKK